MDHVQGQPDGHPSRRTLGFFASCLLGGAVGDALGAAVECESLAQIRARFVPGGIRDDQPVATGFAPETEGR